MRNARPRRRAPWMAVALLSAAAGLFGACAPADSQAQLIYRVSALDGGPPSGDDMMRARSRLDVRLGEAGFERRDVSELGPDRLRVVLPENAAHRMDEVRTVLEQPDGLPVRLALEKR